VKSCIRSGMLLKVSGFVGLGKILLHARLSTIANRGIMLTSILAWRNSQNLFKGQSEGAFGIVAERWRERRDHVA
jgi:hypothetical protein